VTRLANLTAATARRAQKSGDATSLVTGLRSHRGHDVQQQSPLGYVYDVGVDLGARRSQPWNFE